MESILTSIKKLLGIAKDDTAFDTDIVMHINSVFSVLTQIGVGPSEGFTIADEYDVWDDFLNDQPKKLQLVKTYMYLKVKLIFDPPSSSALIESMNRTIGECEWRLNVAADSLGKEENQNG